MADKALLPSKLESGLSFVSDIVSNAYQFHPPKHKQQQLPPNSQIHYVLDCRGESI